MVTNCGSLSPLSLVLSLQKDPQMRWQFSQASLPTFVQQECPSSVSDKWRSVDGHRLLLFHCHHSLTLGCTLVLLWCSKGLPSADGDEPAGDQATSHDNVYNVLVNKKSNAMLIFILFSTEEDLVPFLCCFAKVLPFHFTESKDVPSVSVHFVY